MRDVSSQNFGLLIAYFLPGFTVLWGLSHVSPTVETWIGAAPAEPPTVGGFLYGTIASIAAGLTISTIRWLVIDSLHHATGIPRPRWDFSRLQQHIQAFETLTENQYKFYLFYGNMLLALAFAYVTRRMAEGFWSAPIGWLDAGFLTLSIVFFAGSRDTFRKYNSRLEQILATPGRT